MVVVKDKMFTSEEMKLLTMNNKTLSIDGKFYVCKSCKNFIKKKKIPPCNEKSKTQAGPGLYGPAPSLAYGMRL